MTLIDTNTISYLRIVPAFHYEHEGLTADVLRLFAINNLDFADCYLLARSRREKLAVRTFDKKLARLI